MLNLGPQNLGSRGGPGPRAPLDPRLQGKDIKTRKQGLNLDHL